MNSTDSHVERGNVQDKAIRLFTYLRQLTELRTKVTRRIDDYDEVLWFSDVPSSAECYYVAGRSEIDETHADIWLEIRKPILPPTPPLPPELEPWLDPAHVADASQDLPMLRERILATPTSDVAEDERTERPVEFIELSERPEIEPLWETYVEDVWMPWAEAVKPRLAVQKAYTDLFTIYQRQTRLGETYEVVLGLGYLTWRSPSGDEIKRHLIAAQTSLTFDARRGIVSVGPGGEGANPKLEQEMLELEDRPASQDVDPIEHRLIELGDDIWNHSAIHNLLRAWVNSGSAGGRYEEVLSRQQTVTSQIQVQFAPAIILRKRSERDLVRAFDEIIKQLKADETVPHGVEQLVTIMEPRGREDVEVTETSNLTEGEPSVELYFPLPANDEQRRVAERLAERQGVVVQGPPGTGKSHTIANLISHFLATGQRVLVTSHTARALRVLKDKIPSDITHLCVHLIGNDRNALSELEDSVQGIIDRYNQWDAARNDEETQRLEKSLYEERREHAAIDRKLVAIREAETYGHPVQFNRYEGTAQQIARRLRNEEPKYSWIRDFSDGSRRLFICRKCNVAYPLAPRADADEVRECRRCSSQLEPRAPFSEAESRSLLAMLRETDLKAERDSNKWLPVLDTVTSVETLQSLANAVSQALKDAGNAPAQEHPSRAALVALAQETLVQLRPGVAEFLEVFDRLTARTEEWVRRAAVEVAADRDRPWRELLELTQQHLGAIRERSRWATHVRVTALAARDLREVRADAAAVLGHLKKGGGLGFGPFRPKAVRGRTYIVNEVKIDGRRCDDQSALADLITWLDTSDRLQDLRNLWEPLASIPETSIGQEVALFDDLCEPLIAAVALHERITTLNNMSAEMPAVRFPLWQNRDDVGAFLDAVEMAIRQHALSRLRSKLEEAKSAIQPKPGDQNPHDIVQQLTVAIDARDVSAFRTAREELERIWSLRHRINRCDILLKQLGHVLPKLVSVVRDDPADREWDLRLRDLGAALDWLDCDKWLTAFVHPQTFAGLTRQQGQLSSRTRDRIREIAAVKAWRHFFSRLNEHQRQHLIAWTTAIRRVGKGTGKYAPMHRRNARTHMEECRDAIPAWIMPIYRVAESVRMERDAFDVVIVDEASQSGPEALFLQYIGRKLLVVGDEKQISPEFVGVTRQDVELLRERYIADIPHSDALGIDNSFFDQARIRYGGRLRLREHFRCMPEIIQFCNDLCYRSEPLEPLRQYGTNRLSPVIEVRRVADGFIEGTRNKINRPEAQALVKQIRSCVEDPAYDGKSIGVISLLGNQQARVIEQMLLQEVGPEVFEDRQIVCGDAYAFQGDERDVIFLSMVSAPSEDQRIGTLSKPADERRFNVAVSRAKDQLWLFHTATLNDLSTKCLRYRLLEYCQEPRVGIVREFEAIRLLRRNANEAERETEKPPTPFESWFEVDVFLRIIDKGYRVLPQFEVASYRIDLVVEGMEGRLAVECDGDEWHGPERYNDDMARQRTLERCGWTFWRIRGGAFYRNPDESLESLWRQLSDLRIYPAGASAQLETDLEVAADECESGSQIAGDTSEPVDSFVRRPQQELGKDSPSIRIFGADTSEEDGPSREAQERESETGSDLPSSGATVDTSGNRLAAAPYTCWQTRRLPDPRDARPAEILEALVDIVSAEGPIICHRAYRLFAEAAGIRRIGKNIRSKFNRSMAAAIRDGRLQERNEYGTNDQVNRIVRRTGSPAVKLRTRGDRTIREIPPSELGELTRQILDSNPTITIADEEELFREVLDFYGFRRLTRDVRQMLEMALRVHQLGEADAS